MSCLKKVKKFKKIEHTADIGLKIYGKSLEGLFVNAAEGLYEIAGIKRQKGEAIKENIVFEEGDTESLLVRWLNEIVFALYSKRVYYDQMQLAIEKKQDAWLLEAALSGQKMPSLNCEHEIKAATQGGLAIEKIESGYQTQVIFDV